MCSVSKINVLNCALIQDCFIMKVQIFSNDTFDQLLKNPVTKRECLDSKISFLVRNQGTYQTKEMIKSLRRHSKVFVETLMMKTISFLECD